MFRFTALFFYNMQKIVYLYTLRRKIDIITNIHYDHSKYHDQQLAMMPEIPAVLQGSGIFYCLI